MSSSNHLVKSKIVVRQSIVQLLLGIVSTLFWSGVAIYGVIFPHNVDGIWVYFVVTLLVFLGLWFIWFFIIWKIILKDDTIHFTNCFGKKSTLHLEDVEKVKFRIPSNPKHESEATLITKDGIEFLTVPGTARGAAPFVKYLRRASIKFE